MILDSAALMIGARSPKVVMDLAWVWMALMKGVRSIFLSSPQRIRWVFFPVVARAFSVASGFVDLESLIRVRLGSLVGTCSILCSGQA